MKNKGIMFVFIIIALMVINGGTFWLGMEYQEQRFQSMRSGLRSGGWQTGMPAVPPQGFGRQERGEITVTGKVDKSGF